MNVWELRGLKLTFHGPPASGLQKYILNKFKYYKYYDMYDYSLP